MNRETEGVFQGSALDVGALARAEAQVYVHGCLPQEEGTSYGESTTEAPQPPTPMLCREFPQWLTPVRACFGGVRSLETKI